MLKNKVKISVPASWRVPITSISFVLGIAYGYYLGNIWSLVFILLALLLIAGVVWQSLRVMRIGLIAVVFCLLGVWRIAAVNHVPSEGDIDFYNGQTVSITGTIDAPPDTRPDKTYLTITTKTVQLPNKKSEKNVRGKVLVTTSLFPMYAYGDSVRLRGELVQPNGTGYFNYARYLSKDEIFSLMNKPVIDVINTDQGNFFFAGLFHLRSYLENKINQTLPEPDSSLMAGLLLGARKSLPEVITSGLSRTGLTHIIAISGFNITIIIAFVASYLLGKVRRSYRFVGASLLVVLFTLLVGASASVVRAAVMGVLGLLGVTLGRKNDALNLLLLALLIMAAIWPLSMLLDVGFHLSFLATLGLILVLPLLETWCQKMPSRFALKETLLTTLAAQIMVLPILLLQFEQLSLIAPVTNILVLPVIPVTMLLGFLALLISLVPFLWVLAKLVGFLAWVCTEYIISVVRIFDALPFASFSVAWWNIGLTILFYTALSILLFYSHFREQKNRPAEK